MPELETETQTELEHDATKAVLEAIDWDELTDNLTGDSGFRTSDPRDTYGNLTRFIWRKAAFKTGINDSIPVMAHSSPTPAVNAGCLSVNSRSTRVKRWA